MIAFCHEHGIPHKVCGKVIVATREEELPLLDTLFRRGQDNGVEVSRLDATAVREKEPHVRCLRGLHVPNTGIVDYRQVCGKMAELIAAQGALIQTSTQVTAIKACANGHVIETTRGEVEAQFLVNCGGLQSDRLARAAGVTPRARITPFRGEYYELVPERRFLVKSLIYPVPNPAFPFLGVHFTTMMDGSVHAGPNAVLALKREGYEKNDFAFRDAWDALSYRGFWKLAARHYREGWAEMVRSFSKRAFVRSLQQLIPEITSADVVAAPAGVRAQALLPTGDLVQDFLILPGERSIHVCSAPSPAATASLKIGEAIVAQIPALTATRTLANV